MTLKKSLPFKSNLVRVMNISNSYILDISLKTVEGHITRAFKLLRKMAKSLDY